MSKTANLKDIKTITLILLFLFSSTSQSNNLNNHHLPPKDFQYLIILDRAKAKKYRK